MIFDEETNELYEDCTTSCIISMIEAVSSMSVGDVLEYKCKDGNIIKGIVTARGDCKSCPFIGFHSCSLLPCNSKIKFRYVTEEDEIKIIKSKMISMENIIGRVCNSDVCIYYSNECVQGHSSNKSCLISIIIGNTR